MENTENKTWKVLSSKYVCKRPWLTVRRERAALPNGTIVPEYYVLEYPDWVNVIAITADDKFVFVRQYRHGLGRTLMELCSGVCDPEDAGPLAAAQRELMEETGYGGGDWQQTMIISANPGSQNNLTHCFIATGVERLAEPRPEESEDLTVHLLTPGEVQELLERDEIKQALHAAPLWKYMAGRRKADGNCGM